jgi:hypothetical protein
LGIKRLLIFTMLWWSTRSMSPRTATRRTWTPTT